jgi:hypothetical protein
MKDKILLKTLLTIVTLITIVFLPLWVGPETGKDGVFSLVVEWFAGALALFASLVVIYLLYGLVMAIYDLWNDII